MAQQNTGGFGVAHPVPYAPEPDIKDPEPDLTPSDSQPPGVDEEEWQERGHLRVGPPFHWLLPRTRDTISRLDGGIDHNTN